MSSQVPQTNLSIEQFRLDGMMVACAFYGVFFFLTVQTWIVIMQQPRYGGQIADHRRALLFYVFITFVLGTINFGMNANACHVHLQTSSIDTPSSGHIQGWFLQALLLYRFFVIWNWSRWVMVPMITLYVAMIGLSITVLYQAGTNGSFYNNPIDLAYLCIEVGQTVIYTILVTNRLFVMRGRMKPIMAQYDSSTYDAIRPSWSSSVQRYTRSSLLRFLSIGKIQGIAQLFIIIPIARGGQLHASGRLKTLQ
ncbi:hypothetical protein F4604DRAFT_1931630 [Suillus subluteus]|nr:hypothetical protein F4604DRAFT_1931630 [Suillus subluteus]